RPRASLLFPYTTLFRSLDNVETVVITGGNVAILINRLRLFGLGNMLKAKNVVAWSAGAMALCDRIVLFHDNPPQGRRNPEVFGPDRKSTRLNSSHVKIS